MFVDYLGKRYVFGTAVAFVCGVVVVVIVEVVSVLEEGVKCLYFLVYDCVCCGLRLR